MGNHDGGEGVCGVNNAGCVGNCDGKSVAKLRDVCENSLRAGSVRSHNGVCNELL